MAANTPSTTEPSAPESKTPKITGGAFQDPRIRILMLALAAFAVAFTISWTTGSPTKPPDPPHEPEANDTNILVPAGAKHTVLSDHERAQELLRAARFEQALAIFEKLIDESKSAPPAQLALRLAQCHEELGHWSNALNALQLAAAHGSDTEAMVAQIGQARIHLRRQQSLTAENLLWPIVLRGGDFELESPILSEAVYLLTLAIAQDSLTGRPCHVLEPMTIPPLGLSWDLDRLLACASKSTTNPMNKRRQEFAIDLETDTDRPIVTRAYLPPTPALELLDALVAAGRWSATWTNEAKNATQSRKVSLSITDRPLNSVINDVAASLGLTCEVTATKVEFSSVHKISTTQQNSDRMRHAEQLLQYAQECDANHPLTPAALLAIGNLCAAVKPDDAVAAYECVLKDHSSSKLAVNAAFCQGVAYRRTGKFPEAQRLFYRAVDQAPGHAYAGLAWTHLGQIHLELGEWQQARSVLQRAEAVGNGSPARPTIVLSLAVAKLFGPDPQEAAKMLVQSRETWPDESHRKFAALLTAYARFRQANIDMNRSRDKNTRERNELTVSLLQTTTGAPLGVLGQHLVAMAFSELGLWQQADEIYEKCSGALVGPLAEENEFRRGEAQLRLGKYVEARRHLDAAVATNGRWAALAQYHLAGLDLQENRLDHALARCRQLLRQAHSIPRIEILTLMGRVYDRQGHHHLAAKCFAGQMTDE